MRNYFFIAAVLFSSALHAASMESVGDGSIRILYEQTGDADQVAQFKKKILPTVKDIIAKVSADLGVGDRTMNAEIDFYSPETYYNKFPDAAEKQIPAKYVGKIIYAKTDNNEVDHLLQKTLRHELTHLILDVVYGKVPGWVNEGLATLEERKITTDPTPNNHDYNTIYMSKQNGSYRAIAELENYDVFGRAHGTVTAGYGYVFGFVTVYELIQKFGFDSLQTFLKNYSKGKTIKDAFDASYTNLTYEKLEPYIFDLSQKKS